MSPKNKKALALKKSLFTKTIRAFFEKENFHEIETPYLVRNPGLEPNLEYFSTKYSPSMDTTSQASETLYLPTSPEYHLKKALSWGFERIFEIKRCFRNGEHSKHHSPEFTMLEWYRSPGNYHEISLDFMALTQFISQTFETPKHWQKHQNIELSDLFQTHAQINLEQLIEADRHQELPQYANSQNIAEYKKNDSFEDLFHKIFLTRIEKKLPREGFVFIWNYPFQLGALSRLKEDSPNYCQRFEVYWNGLELGNCFDEECESTRVHQLCQSDLKKRQSNFSESPPPLDDEFIKAHEKINQAGGIAVGLDRLFMSLHSMDNIDHCQLFPFSTFSDNKMSAT